MVNTDKMIQNLGTEDDLHSAGWEVEAQGSKISARGGAEFKPKDWIQHCTPYLELVFLN